MQESKRYRLSWKDLSGIRGQIYGWSILSIILFHFAEGLVSSDTANNGLRALAVAYNAIVGSIGVDVFVILSGFGIYHSLSRSSDLGRYYHRRAVRVLLPYAIVGTLFWLVKDLLVLGLPLSSFPKDLFFVSFVTNGVRTVWYVPFIMLMYAIAPLVYRVMKRGCPALLLVAAWLVVCLGLSMIKPKFFDCVEIALTRVSAFLLGMGCGKLAEKGEEVPGWLVAVTLLALPLRLIASPLGRPMERTANVLYAGFIIVLIVFAYRLVDVERMSGALRGFFDRAGACSYELYLTHVLIRNLLGTIGADLTNPFVYAGIVATSIPLALLLQKLQQLEQGTG